MIASKLVFRTLASRRGLKVVLPMLYEPERWHTNAPIREAAHDDTNSVQIDLVRSTVKDLLEHKDVPKTITAEHLQQSHQSFLNRLKEARLCIVDCEELKLTGGEELQLEADQASKAVDDAFAAFLDLLEEFQGCDEEVRKQFADVREDSTMQLKALRIELDRILPSRC